jgi:hypothetical protein
MRYSYCLLLVLTGCQCCSITEPYQDRIDVIADREGRWDALYSPAFDLTRIGRPDWCSYPVNHWLCPCRCERPCQVPYCPHVWQPPVTPIPALEWKQQQEREKAAQDEPGVMIPDPPIAPTVEPQGRAVPSLPREFPSAITPSAPGSAPSLPEQAARADSSILLMQGKAQLEDSASGEAPPWAQSQIEKLPDAAAAERSAVIPLDQLPRNRRGSVVAPRPESWDNLPTTRRRL